MNVEWCITGSNHDAHRVLVDAIVAAGMGESLGRQIVQVGWRSRVDETDLAGWPDTGYAARLDNRLDDIRAIKATIEGRFGGPSELPARFAGMLDAEWPGFMPMKHNVPAHVVDAIKVRIAGAVVATAARINRTLAFGWGKPGNDGADPVAISRAVQLLIDCEIDGLVMPCYAKDGQSLTALRRRAEAVRETSEMIGQLVRMKRPHFTVQYAVQPVVRGANSVITDTLKAAHWQLYSETLGDELVGWLQGGDASAGDHVGVARQIAAGIPGMGAGLAPVEREGQ